MPVQIQRRSIATTIILSIVTCGIYGYYWLYKMASEIEPSGAPNAVGMSAGMILLLEIITCGYFGIYVNYKWGKAIPEMFAQRGMMAEDRSILYLILPIVGLNIVAWALMQDDLNKIATY